MHLSVRSDAVFAGFIIDLDEHELQPTQVLRNGNLEVLFGAFDIAPSILSVSPAGEPIRAIARL
ncbi:hypothetical protein C6569_17050 [Phreatobacter cathodiphilus]|uniref:Uncharacterized protein n=1 Tax=Phreatobacter cathodiphilus TaxID=1868589 RepID=A0A2S0NEN5_9HYPH|nr:hypothetical protein C6569_17050 [Phreatobacter cathodiphilus]